MLSRQEIKIEWNVNFFIRFICINIQTKMLILTYIKIWNKMLIFTWFSSINMKKKTLIKNIFNKKTKWNGMFHFYRYHLYKTKMLNKYIFFLK